MLNNDNITDHPQTTATTNHQNQPLVTTNLNSTGNSTNTNSSSSSSNSPQNTNTSTSLLTLKQPQPPFYLEDNQQQPFPDQLPPGQTINMNFPPNGHLQNFPDGQNFNMLPGGPPQPISMNGIPPMGFNQMPFPGQMMPGFGFPMGMNDPRHAPEGKKRSSKKRKKKDPNEPSRPVSAYALFFRETQAHIKARKPDSTFGEISKEVARLWDSLEDEKKQMFKKKTENAKREYLRELAAYRASLVSINNHQMNGLGMHHGPIGMGMPYADIFENLRT